MKRLFFLFMLFSSLNLSAKVNGDIYITPFKGNHKAAISFTFDDGMLCHYTDVAPELEKRGFRGTFWIIGANMGKDEKDYPWMTWEQVAELAKRGHETSNHSWTHPNLTMLSKENLMHEILKCDSVIEAKTGKRPITFCYPYNAMNDMVVSAASANRVGTRTFQEAQGQDVSKCTKESMSLWLKKVIENKEWAVTMTHGTTYGYDKWEDPSQLWDFFDEVKSKENEVWIGTFAEVAAYREECAKTRLRTLRLGKSYYIKPVMDLDEHLFKEHLTLRINGDFNGKTIIAKQGKNELKVINNGNFILVNFIPSGKRVSVKVK